MFNLKRLIFTMVIVLICGFAYPQSGYVFSEQLFDHAASRSYGSQIITKLLPNGQLPIEDEVQTPPVNTISAYPNPMKDEVTIKISQDDQSISAENKLSIFNIKGQLIRSLKLTKGETVWDGKDSGGKPCPKGIYLLRYQYGTSQITKICKTY
ncbi:MAG: T9SS type A sorting domain-containing protein [Candidatus Cloacimonetes bacterium]|jgi:hypothetical protein|nr:T9SS type A sorting domain-containing protein [Candidatus Cloacimonadota bacterium]MCK9183741.1 T9SS type A sorting domain-containing protein [Candidatus Cloacimonadota bacterium]MCK9585191.1 T9SS type A sorting domain-containing protein [Candidatus Cloacimonadota bacterium]